MKIEMGIGWVLDEKTPGNLRTAYDRDYVAEIKRLRAELAEARRTEGKQSWAELDAAHEANRVLTALLREAQERIPDWTTGVNRELLTRIAAAIRRGEP